MTEAPRLVAVAASFLETTRTTLPGAQRQPEASFLEGGGAHALRAPTSLEDYLIPEDEEEWVLEDEGGRLEESSFLEQKTTRAVQFTLRMSEEAAQKVQSDNTLKAQIDGALTTAVREVRRGPEEGGDR